MSVSELCQRCGLCCDGTLFTHVPLKRGEETVLRQHGLEVGQRADGATVLWQGCRGLEGRCCRVYAVRPEGCRRYQCLLYTALAEGEVGLPEALEVVEGAHTRVAAVASALGPAGDTGARSIMERARQAGEDGREPLVGEAREAWLEAEAWLDRHFRGRHRRPGS